MVMRESNDLRYELVAESAAGVSPESPLRMLRRVLRGRLGLTASMAALFACAGGVIGYGAMKPKYESTGLVHVQGEVPAILYDTPANQAPPMFDSYLSSLVTYFRSPPVLEIAINQPEMRAIGWPEGVKGVAALQRSIRVIRGRREQLIQVSVVNADPERAQIATNAVLTAIESYTSEPNLSTGDQIVALESREQELSARIDTLRGAVLEVSNQYGASAIRRMHDQKIRELVELESRLAAVRVARTQLQDGTTGDIPDELFVSGLQAEVDEHVTRLRTQESTLLGEMGTLSAKYGDRHPIMREKQRQLEAIRMQIDMRTKTGGMIAATDIVDGANAARIDELEARYVRLRDAAREDASVLAGRAAEILTLEERIDETQHRLTETRTRIDQLAVEAKRGDIDRITVEGWANTPVVPISDRRRGLATAGSIAGCVAGIALVFLLGLTDGRLRYVDELDALQLPVPLIGIMPEVSNDAKTRKQAHRNVHQLRNLLELQLTEPSSNVFCITSCGHGDGKTSLAIGLATSFAAAGRRTLVIDADITGRRLTQELGLESASGLCESIGPDNRSGKVHRTAQSELWAMPVGATAGVNPEDLSRDRLVHLLDALRTRFDAIIIDTGPIRSSIEACLVSAVSDRAVMVVARNQAADRLQAAIDRLDQVGAVCAGVVFNRAQPGDLIRKAEDMVPRTASDTRLVPLAQPIRAHRGPAAQASEVGELAFRLTDAPDVAATCSPPPPEKRRAA